MNKDNQIMELALPTREAADLTERAAKHGVPVREFLGIQALAGAYGVLHPLVVAFHQCLKTGQSETKTEEPGREEPGRE